MRLIEVALATLLMASAVSAQEIVPEGCWVTFESGECFWDTEVLWENYGADENLWVYGPVGTLLNNLVEWHDWAVHLQTRVNYQKKQKRFYKERLLKLRRTIWGSRRK
jgi:hypothetical protein